MLVHALEASRQPRILLLEEAGKVLVLSCLPPVPSDTAPAVFTEFVDAKSYMPLVRAKLKGQDTVLETDGLGCIGLLNLSDRTFVMIVTQAEFVGLDYPGMRGMGCENAWRVKNVSFFCLDNGSVDPDPRGKRDHPCAGVHKYLTNGNFYYSGTTGFDITSRMDVRLKREEEADRMESFEEALKDDAPTAHWFNFRSSHNPADHSGDSDLVCDPRFLFNTFALAVHLQLRGTLHDEDRDAFDTSGFMVPLIQGYYGMCHDTVNGEVATLSVRSRLGWRRAGTRFNRRGIDERDPFGTVANFAETETIFRIGDNCFSFVQVRGSVPLVWSEKGSTVTGTALIKVHEPLQTLSLDPLRRHFYSLFDEYSRIHVIDLLYVASTIAALVPERYLADSYQHIASIARKKEREFSKNLTYQEFDEVATKAADGFAEVPKILNPLVRPVVEDFGATVVKLDGKGRTSGQLSQQKGVFRVNCRDCLDRTNLSASLISAQALDFHLEKLGLPHIQEVPSVQASHRVLFYENGNALSESYAGSVSMDCIFTRTGVYSKEDEHSNAIMGEMRTRNYQDPTRDDAKQAAIDQLIGRSSPSIECITRRDVELAGREAHW